MLRAHSTDEQLSPEMFSFLDVVEGALGDLLSYASSSAE